MAAPRLVTACLLQGNASFYPRIGPTSFFSLFARAPTDEQAKRMVVEWLHSPTRFCVSPTGDMKGNNDLCYWGLPSISADDAAGVLKNDLGYWRGFVRRRATWSRQCGARRSLLRLGTRRASIYHARALVRSAN